MYGGLFNQIKEVLRKERLVLTIFKSYSDNKIVRLDNLNSGKVVGVGEGKVNIFALGDVINYPRSLNIDPAVVSSQDFCDNYTSLDNVITIGYEAGDIVVDLLDCKGRRVPKLEGGFLRKSSETFQESYIGMSNFLQLNPDYLKKHDLG